MTTNGLVILVASTTNNTFEGPSIDFFATGDDIEVARWDLSLNGLDGVLFDSRSGVVLSGNWTATDPLALYWFPTLTTNAASPGANTEYGTYFDLTGIDGSDPWVTPSDGGSVDLRFFTADATILNSGGSNPASAGNALFNTPAVPEPNSLAWLALAVVGWTFTRSRRVEP